MEDAPESYGLFAWWVEHHVEAPDAKKPFLIVFGDAPMHRTIPKEQIARLLGETARKRGTRPGKEGLVDPVWFRKPRPTTHLRPGSASPSAGTSGSSADRPAGDEVDRQWASAIGEDRVFRIDDEQRAVDYAMGLVARSWGRFGDFQANMRAAGGSEGEERCGPDPVRRAARPRLPGLRREDPAGGLRADDLQLLRLDARAVAP
ncbi:MAG: hypothetical protein IPP07_26205 [Holophagales bacterium]|nr:hypothetical protein [Holophagales bacterium]